MRSNNSFKPNLLRYTKAVAEKYCHGFGSTTQVDLTQALGRKMEITAIGRYKLSFDSARFSVECPLGTAKFSGLATSGLPKLYVASVDGNPIYVGITKQPIRNRLRLGWTAKGESGYYGYAWRHKFTTANLDLWCHTNPATENACLDIETVEAELVYLIRKAGQWPLFQTEIHFHPSTEVHRAVAAQVGAQYGIAP